MKQDPVGRLLICPPVLFFEALQYLLIAMYIKTGESFLDKDYILGFFQMKSIIHSCVAVIAAVVLSLAIVISLIYLG